MSNYGEPAEGWDIYLRSLRSAVEVKYGQRNQRILDVHDRRWNIRKADVPANFKQTTRAFEAPLIRDMIRRSRSIMSASLPTPKVPPLGAEVDDQADADRREEWLVAAYRRLTRHTPIMSRVIDAMLATGTGVWKVFLKLDRWGEEGVPQAGESLDADYVKRYERVKKSHFPFAWEYIPTATFATISRDADGIAETMEITRRETVPLMSFYGLALGPDGTFRWADVGEIRDVLSPIPFTVDFIEYWNRDTYVIMVENMVVSVGSHDLGRPPYFIANFAETSEVDPAFETEGVADALISLQDNLENFVTINMNWLYLNGFPVARLRPISEEAVQDYEIEEDLVAKAGGTMKAPPGYVWEWVPPPQVSAGFDMVRSLLKDMADQLSLAPILYGQAQSISGPVASTLIAVAKALFGPGLDSLSRAFDDMAGWMEWCIENVIKDDVPIFDSLSKKWRTLGPGDIGGYYEVEHSLKPVIPMEAMQKSIHLTNAQRAGAVSMRYLREEGLNLSNPGAMDKEVATEAIRKSPEYRNALMLKVLEIVRPQKPEPQASLGSAPRPPVGPGGPGQPQIAGIQQPEVPGSENLGEGFLAGENAAESVKQPNPAVQ